MSGWYVAHTKIRQEKVALENLERQGYRCYLPSLRTEKLLGGLVKIVDEPLFPRYMFIALDDGLDAKSWAPIRSTVGVSRLVSFGQRPAKIDEDLLAAIKERTDASRDIKRRFEAGDPVRVTQGPFAGLDAVFYETDGEARAVVLLSLLSKQVRLALPPSSIKAS